MLAPTIALNLKLPEPLSQVAGRRRTLEIALYDRDELVASGSQRLAGSADPSVSLSWHASAKRKWNYPYRMAATFSDGAGTHLTLEWDAIGFVPPWSERAPFRSLIVALLIVVAVSLIRLGTGSVPVLGPWVPTATYLSGVLISGLPRVEEWVKIDATFLTAYLVAFAVVGVVSGALSPRAFRLLAGMAPFHVIAPAVLTWRPFRQ